MVRTFEVEESETSFMSQGLRLRGTLAMPSGTRRPPACLVLQGSGEADRDSNVRAGRARRISNITRDIAHALTRRGIATFRYDKRGTGTSEGDGHGFHDLVRDATAAMSHLASTSYVDRGRLLVLGHSEGGMLATIIASRDHRVRGLVGVCTPAERLDLGIIKQMGRILESKGIDHTRSEEMVAGIEHVIDMVRENGWEDLPAREVKRALRPSGLVNRLLPAPMVKRSFGQQLRPTWLIEGSSYDMPSMAEGIECPALLVYGSADYHVPASTAGLLADSIDECRTLVVDGMNHMVRVVHGPSSPKSSIRSLREPMDEATVTQIADWCLDTLGVDPDSVHW